MSKPAPGSPAAVLDAVVRAVTEGRYRYALLHLTWNRDRVGADEMATMVSQASAVSELPPSLTAAAVIESGKPQLIPGWLDAALDVEIGRIFSRLPVASSAQRQIVARIAAAVCIDVCADTIDATLRAARPAAVTEEAPVPRRMIHLGAPEVINLEHEKVTETGGPTIPPPPR